MESCPSGQWGKGTPIQLKGSTPIWQRGYPYLANGGYFICPVAEGVPHPADREGIPMWSMGLIPYLADGGTPIQS